MTDLCVRNLAMKQNAKFRWVGKNSGLILSHLWTNVHDILGHCSGVTCRRLFVVSNAIPHPSCLCHGLFWRYLLLSHWSIMQHGFQPSS